MSIIASKNKRSYSLKLSDSDVNRLKQIFLSYVNNEAVPKGGMTEYWYLAVLDFMLQKNWDLCRPDLIEIEKKILENEMTETYVDTLMSQIAIDEGLEDHERIFLLITAGSDIRMDIAKRVLNLI